MDSYQNKIGILTVNVPSYQKQNRSTVMMMIAFITVKSSLVPLIEGLCAQIMMIAFITIKSSLVPLIDGLCAQI